MQGAETSVLALADRPCTGADAYEFLEELKSTSPLPGLRLGGQAQLPDPGERDRSQDPQGAASRSGGLEVLQPAPLPSAGLSPLIQLRKTKGPAGAG